MHNAWLFDMNINVSTTPLVVNEGHWHVPLPVHHEMQSGMGLVHLRRSQVRRFTQTSCPRLAISKPPQMHNAWLFDMNINVSTAPLVVNEGC